MTPTDPPTVETMAPGDWPAEPERRYAERQADLARQCDLDIASRVVETDVAGRVHFLEAGDPDGDPVLLLHGITEPAATWLPMAPALAEDWVARVGVVDDSAVPEAYYELYASRFGLPGLSASLRSLMTGASSFGRMRPLVDLRDEIVTIDRPTAFVWGTEDYYWPPAVGRAVAERMPDAAFHELSGHGHAPWLEPGDAAETRVRVFPDG